MKVRFQPSDSNFAARIRESFRRQRAMQLLGARMIRVEPGLVQIELPYREDLTQQHGYFHGGFTSAIADSAGGYAGYSLFPADSSVLTVEFKISLLAPAKGEKLVATGRVLKPGRTLTVCELSVVALEPGRETACAHGLQTLICLAGRADAPTPA
jgi:uncharacterized protein (TIGR00369 family)